MGLNHTTLASGLAAIFNVPSQYIVLQQGNWFNPQDYFDNTQGKPNTWVAFRIKNAKPRSLPFQVNDPNDPLNMYDVTYYTSEVDLQIVGNSAQQLAESISHWLNRQDVQQTFLSMDAQLMGTEGGYTVTNFYQGGAEFTNRSNVVLSYNTSIKIEWASAIHVYSTTGTVVTGVTISGTMLIPS
jgi:hypothetical protein